MMETQVDSGRFLRAALARFYVLIDLNPQQRFHRSNRRLSEMSLAVIDPKLQQQIEQLTLQQKQELSAWLSKKIQAEASTEGTVPPTKKNRQLVERKRIGAITYQLEMVKCGKAGCKCSRGELHGPYWYAYQRQGDRFKSTYIGKRFTLPPEEPI